MVQDGSPGAKEVEDLYSSTCIWQPRSENTAMMATSPPKQRGEKNLSHFQMFYARYKHNAYSVKAWRLPISRMSVLIFLQGILPAVCRKSR